MCRSYNAVLYSSLSTWDPTTHRNNQHTSTREIFVGSRSASGTAGATNPFIRAYTSVRLCQRRVAGVRKRPKSSEKKRGAWLYGVKLKRLQLPSEVQFSNFYYADCCSLCASTQTHLSITTSKPALAAISAASSLTIPSWGTQFHTPGEGNTENTASMAHQHCQTCIQNTLVPSASADATTEVAASGHCSGARNTIAASMGPEIIAQYHKT